MSKKPSYKEVLERLQQAESILDSIKKGEVDILLGDSQPLVIKLKSITDYNEKLLKENKKMANEWKTTFEAIDNAIWLLNKNDKIIRTNNSNLNSFYKKGIDPNGKNYNEVVLNKYLCTSDSPLNRAKHTLKREQTEIKISDDIWVEITVDPIVNNGYEGAIHIVRDITLRKQSELKLKESENLYYSIFETTGTATLLVDEQTNILKVNQECVEVFGYAKEELLGESWKKYVCPESLEEMIKYHNLRKEKPKLASNKYEVVLFHKDGSKRNVVVEISMIPDTKKSVVSLLDITEQKKALIESQTLQARLQDTLESITDGVVMFDKNMDYTYINSQGAKLLGSSSENLIGKNYYKLYPKAKGTEFENAYQQVLETQKPLEFSAIYKPWNRWFNNRIFPTEEGIVVYFTEITDKIQSKRLLKTLFKTVEESPLSIILTDNKGNIDFVNNKFSKNTQYSLTEVRGKKPRIFNPGHVDEKQFSEMWHKIKKGEVWEGEFYNRKKDGSFYWESVIISSISDNNGKISNYILIIEDITHKRETELQVQLLSHSV